MAMFSRKVRVAIAIGAGVGIAFLAYFTLYFSQVKGIHDWRSGKRHPVYAYSLPERDSDAYLSDLRFRGNFNDGTFVYAFFSPAHYIDKKYIHRDYWEEWWVEK
jgi:hypothetical protein